MWKNQKDIDSRLFFALNGVLEKMGKVSLKVLEKCLNFLSKKGTKPVGASMGRLCPRWGAGDTFSDFRYMKG